MGNGLTLASYPIRTFESNQIWHQKFQADYCLQYFTLVSMLIYSIEFYRFVDLSFEKIYKDLIQLFIKNLPGIYN